MGAGDHLDLLRVLVEVERAPGALFDRTVEQFEERTLLAKSKQVGDALPCSARRFTRPGRARALEFGQHGPVDGVLFVADECDGRGQVERAAVLNVDQVAKDVESSPESVHHALGRPLVVR